MLQRFIFPTLIGFLVQSFAFAQNFSTEEIAKWQQQANQITIVKDKWGVPHVYTKTDADAVFGMMYVQCEEFFSKVENSLIVRLGRQAEVNGESDLYQDLWAKTFIDPTKALQFYHRSPKWLRKLCDAYAAGINFYLLSHPQIKPRLLTRVEPWMAFMNNIPSIANSNLTEVEFRAFYGKDASVSFTSVSPSVEHDFQQAGGSNGWAIAPSRTQNKNAILLINPHSEFYGRIEIHLVSEEGLNSYGAPFLGQFNIFQGFNEHLGWMHPVTLSDGKDLYAETVTRKENGYVYQYDGKSKAVDSSKVTLRYKKGGELLSKTFTIYRTHHGPVVAVRNKKWISLKSQESNIDLLAVNWQKMKAKNLAQFTKVLNKRVMVGNNIVYADRDGNIGYWHGNFVPKRNPSYDWKRQVDGSIKETEWQGTHALEELPHYINPTNGWLQNCNSTPLYAAGKFDSVMNRKPIYMLPDGNTPRAVNAVRVLSQLQNATLDDVIKAAHDPYLPNAARFIPSLIASFEKVKNDTVFAALAGTIKTLSTWDYRTDTSSVATTLAVLWTERLVQMNVAKLPRPITNEEQYSVTNGSNLSVDFLSSAEQVKMLSQVVMDLRKDFGTWEVSWGKINRFQRLADGKPFSDTEKSWAVPATPGYMGSLNAYVSRKATQTKARYGVTGNTFVAAVEFGKVLKAKTVLTGGASTDSTSPHYTDQINGYINAQFKEIFFYKKDVLANAERTYKPGE